MSPIFRIDLDDPENVKQIDSITRDILEESARVKGHDWPFPENCRLFFVTGMGAFRRYVTAFAELGPYYHQPDRYGHDYPSLSSCVVGFSTESGAMAFKLRFPS